MQSILQTLSNAPSEAWLGLIGVIVGATLSVLGIWLTNRSALRHLKIQIEHQQSEKTKSIKRERLEELYVLTDKWINVFTSHFLKLSLVMKGQIDYNQYLDQIIAEGKESSMDFSRLQMIVDIYGTELHESFKAILVCREEINDITFTHKQAYRSGYPEGITFLKPYTDANIKIAELGGSFMKEIAVLAKNV